MDHVYIDFTKLLSARSWQLCQVQYLRPWDLFRPWQVQRSTITRIGSRWAFFAKATASACIRRRSRMCCTRSTSYEFVAVYNSKCPVNDSTKVVVLHIDELLGCML